MVLFQAIVAGKPVGKARPRVTRTGHAFTPAKTAAWEKRAAGVMASEWGLPPLDRPVSVRVVAVHDRPQDQVPSAWQLRARPELAGRLWRARKPDLDNVVKAALDALVRAAVLVDDALVVHLEALGLWAAIGEGAHVEVEILSLSPGIAVEVR